MSATSVTIASAGATVQANTEAAQGVFIKILSNSFVGTLLFEATTDGTNWDPVAAYPLLASGLWGAAAVSTTAAGAFVIPSTYAQVRVRCSVFTSGTALAIIDPVLSCFPGTVPVNHEGQKATYSFAINAHAPAATPTDWLTILGSATKTIRLLRLRIRCRATAGNQYRVTLKKYSTVYTVGTPAAVTMTPHDSANAAATAVVQTWAGALPTVGALVGAITDDSIPCAVLGTPGYGWQEIYNYGSDGPQQSLVLRGTAQYLALNSNAVALPAGFVADVNGTFSEE